MEISIFKLVTRHCWPVVIGLLVCATLLTCQQQVAFSQDVAPAADVAAPASPPANADAPDAGDETAAPQEQTLLGWLYSSKIGYFTKINIFIAQPSREWIRL